MAVRLKHAQVMSMLSELKMMLMMKVTLCNFSISMATNLVKSQSQCRKIHCDEEQLWQQNISSCILEWIKHYKHFQENVTIKIHTEKSHMYIIWIMCP